MNSSDLAAAVGAAVKAKQDQIDSSLPRRSFLKLSSVLASGMVLASVQPMLGVAATADVNPEAALMVTGDLNAFVSIASDGKITIYSANAEMGQGIKTALPMIIAEEMGANWDDVEVVQSRWTRSGSGVRAPVAQPQFRGPGIRCARWVQPRRTCSSAPVPW